MGRLETSKAIQLLRRQQEKEIESCWHNDPQVTTWWNFTEQLVANAFGENHPNKTAFCSENPYSYLDLDSQSRHVQRVNEKKALLASFIDQLEMMPPTEAVEVVAEREGFYFSGQTFDAMLRASKLFAAAKSRIVVIDGYVGEELLNLLTVKANAVQVDVLTKADPRYKSLSPNNKQLCIAFQNQHGNLEVRSSNEFHDRFVILDDSEFYHFGASIKDLGKRGFMFSRIEEGLVIDAVRDQFEKVWKAATVEVP